MLLAGVLASQLFATPIPQNLGSGLRAIVEKQSGRGATATKPSVIDYDKLKITDAQNRLLVNIMLNGAVPLKTMVNRITDLGDNKITATEPRYRAGVVEAFVSPAQAARIATMEGVTAVNLVPKPVTNVGTATTQGIVKHRINQLPPGINGSGITVGVLSDSYNRNGGDIRASHDIASGDLPGPANPFGNTKQVVVFQEYPFGIDEGRAMLQIVHDIAPKARLGFATAFTGEVGFADNIRSLAGLPSGSRSKPNFKADVIIDDIIYLAEPMFQDGIIAQAVDDVAAAGVAYFSSAGNRPASQGYDSDFRFVRNSAAAPAGTNLNFSGVDPALYKGGFHDFAQADGIQDIAQTIHIDGFGIIVFQWNEPYDSTPPTLGAVLQSGSGTLTNANPTKSFDFDGTAGQQIAIFANADPGSSNPLPDVTITLFDPQGNEVAFQDQTTNPETLITFLPVTGTYEIRIGGFLGATGDFIYRVREASGTPFVESDFNLLIFDLNGDFLGAIAENNRATNRPIELALLFGTFDFQLVIARANKPPQGTPAADHLRYIWFSGGFPREYVSYASPATYGHNSAAGGNGVAAYAFFPPFVPESFTSTGPSTIYFDRNNNRLPEPQRRLKPDMAAMDGANTTFFFADASQDPDDLPNFFGTSAAAPHAGGIAALMLQAAGGPHSLSPNRVRHAMQASAFLHDLDPSHAEGVADKANNFVFLSARGDGSNTSAANPNFFKVTYFGDSSLTSLKLNLTEANPTERPTPGLVFDRRGIGVGGFPFTLGHLHGVPASAIDPTFSAPAPPPGVAGHFQELTLSMPAGAMNNGNIIRFGVDRDEADAFGPVGTVGGNSADLLGSGVLLPQGTFAPGGATFSATLANGDVLRGTFMNIIGHGYSRLDGFGFVNAEAAVQAVQPVQKP